jgi:HAD superfamily hydrolase (TIGR01450 family)
VAVAATEGRLVDAYDLVILDLDGVVYLGEEPVPGAVEAIERLRREGPPVVFVTNNASRSPDDVAALLTRLGVAATGHEVLTSAAVAADQLADRLAPGSAVLVVGSEALAAEVRRAGLSPVESADDKPVAVVQGYDPQVGWAQLAEACLAIRAGASWVVTNADATLPSPRGALPGNGALVAALRTALGQEPDLVVGKPQPTLFTAAAARTGSQRPLVVGDRLDTDIEGAARAGMDSLLVLTGVSTAAQARSAAPAARPTYLGADLAALFAPADRPDGA